MHVWLLKAGNLYEMLTFFNCNDAVACSDSRQKAECVAKSVYIHKHIIWYTKIKRDEKTKVKNERDQTLTYNTDPVNYSSGNYTHDYLLENGIHACM